MYEDQIIIRQFRKQLRGALKKFCKSIC